jgi:hypothetical protein
MTGALAPLSIQTIAQMAGVSYFRARRALHTLVALHTVIASGQPNNRRYALIQSSMGNLAGGPASEKSAAGACAGACLTSAARPGSAGESRSDHQTKSRAA